MYPLHPGFVAWACECTLPSSAPSYEERPSQCPPPPGFLMLGSALCLSRPASLMSEPPPCGHVGLALMGLA